MDPILALPGLSHFFEHQARAATQQESPGPYPVVLWLIGFDRFLPIDGCPNEAAGSRAPRPFPCKGTIHTRKCKIKSDQQQNGRIAPRATKAP